MPQIIPPSSNDYKLLSSISIITADLDNSIGFSGLSLDANSLFDYRFLFKSNGLNIASDLTLIINSDIITTNYHRQSLGALSAGVAGAYLNNMTMLNNSSIQPAVIDGLITIENNLILCKYNFSRTGINNSTNLVGISHIYYINSNSVNSFSINTSNLFLDSNINLYKVKRG